MGTANDKLLGRVAVAAKMITDVQLGEANEALASGSTSGRSLDEVLFELGFVDAAKLRKLLAMHKSVVAKAKAKRQEGAADADVSRPAEAAVQPAAAPEPEPPAAASPEAATVEPAPPPEVERRVERPFGEGDLSDAIEHGETSDAVAADSIALETTEDMPGFESTAIVEPASTSEAPARSAPAVIPNEPPPDLDPQLYALMRAAHEASASDLHVHSRAIPRLRVRSVFSNFGEEVIPSEAAERMGLSLLNDEQRAAFEEAGELDFSYTLPGVGRFRTNIYRQLRGTDIVMRRIPNAPPTLAELGLPESLAKLATYHQGMVLITGPTSCGKSSTMAAFVNMINKARQEHILTIEDPIEYLHESQKCVVNQRNVHRHTESFGRALRGALREDPDVIVIGELRDRETVSLAMTAAETGHFVLATLHTDNAVRTVNRILGSFPPDQQEQVRAMLSESLKAVISQRLLPSADGTSLVPALEVMMVNRAVGNLIRDQKTIQIRSVLQTGQNLGMTLLDNSLAELVKAGKVTREEAMRHVEDPKLIP